MRRDSYVQFNPDVFRHCAVTEGLDPLLGAKNIDAQSDDHKGRQMFHTRAGLALLRFERLEEFL